MDLRWFLLTVGVSCCVIQSLCSDPSLENILRRLDTSLPLGTIFGHGSCEDETCFPLSESAEPVTKFRDTSPEGRQEDYEPQNPDVVSPTPDILVEHCLPLHISTIHDAAIIDMRHPDVDVSVKLKVIKDLVRYAFHFSSVTTEDCDPAMKLLDIIILAANKLREDYINECGKTCNYTTSTNDGQSTTPKSTEEPASASPKVPTEASTEKPCPNNEEPNVTEKPCSKKPSGEMGPNEEMIAGDSGREYKSSLFVGSLRGIPGVHYPNYTEVPITTFSCADKKYLPGFYADLDTRCQVFHVCYEHRQESFLCPVGTIFNQPILACDYWYSSNCSLAQQYYDVNAETGATSEEETDAVVDDLITIIQDAKEIGFEKPRSQMEVDIKQFLPVKATITEFTKPTIKEKKTISMAKPEVQKVDEVASQIFNKIVSTATHVVSKTRDVIHKIPEPSEPKFKIKPVPVEAKLAKAKLTAAIPVAKVAKYKLTAAKAAVPIVVKAKLAAKVAAVPIAAKAKLAATVPAAKIAAVPIAAKAKLAATVPAKKVALKAAVPVTATAKLVAAVPKVAMKTKMISSALPLAKAKIVAPALKGKSLKTAGIPVVKAKLAKAAAISPLTKKALALGYMKLLKAKKVALMG